MARNDRDRNSPQERRDAFSERREDERAADPIRAATPSPSQVQRESERQVMRERERPPVQQVTGSAGESRWDGHNRNSDGVPQSISSLSGGDEKSNQPNRVVIEDKPKEPDAKPDPAPSEPQKPATGRSKQRQSTLALDKTRPPEGQTKQDARREKTSRKPERDRQKRSPEGQTKQDARSNRKQEVVCKAPPRGDETKPKGSGGSGKRFVPYIGSKACK